MKEKILEKYNAFKVRNANYYKEAFLKIDQKNKITFNAAAFLFSTNWMFYRRMWFSAMAYVIVLGILTSGIDAICKNNGLNPRNYIAIAYLSVLVIFGYFSNSLYRMELRWKMKQGYHQNPNFSPTSLRSMVFVPIILVIARNLLTWSFAFLWEAAIQLLTLSIYAIACYYEYRTYNSKNAGIEPKAEDMNQYLDKEGNDMSVIVAAAYYFFTLILVLISVCIIAAMRIVNRKIISQLNSIAENIDKMDANNKSQSIEEKTIAGSNAITKSV